MKLRQFNVSLLNKPGKLLEVLDAFAEEKININGLNVVPTINGHGIARVIVANVAKAREILMKKHPEAEEVNVIAVALKDEVGSMAALLRPIFDKNINLVFTYTLTGVNSGKAVMICRFSDNDQAIDIMVKKGYTILNKQAFYKFAENGTR